MALNVSDKDVLSALTGVKASTNDDIRLEKNLFLSEHSLSSARTSTDSDVTKNENIHYLSPASLSSISDVSEYEGEPSGYSYKSPSFMKLLHTYGKETRTTLTSTISCAEPGVQRTLAIVKPDAVKYEDVILRAIIDAGLFILYKRFVHFTPEQASEIYSQHYGLASFPHMVVQLSSGPVLCLCLCGFNAVERWKSMIGPHKVINSKWFYPMSMRVRFGLLSSIPEALHASKTLADSNKENRYVHPETVIEPLTCDEEKVVDFCSVYVNETLTQGLAEVCRVKPEDPVCFLADWLLKNNPYEPQLPLDLAIIPT